MALFPQGSGIGPLRRRGADSWQYGTVSPVDPALPETTNITRQPTRILAVLLAVLVTAMTVRAGFIVFATPQLEERARGNHLRTYVTRALRGSIFDADGTQLVVNEDRDDLALIPADVPRDPDERRMLLEELAALTGLDPVEAEALLTEYRYTYSPVVVKSRLTQEQKVDVRVRFEDGTKGVTIVRNFSRQYTQPSTAFSHLLGYVSRITAEEYAQLRGQYRPMDEIGKAGVEGRWEETLRGDDGERRISVDARGAKVATLATTEPRAGCDVVLNVRAPFQERVQQILRNHLRAGGFDAGVVVAMDPRSGAIRALVSLPTYDHGIFADGIKGKEEVAEFQRLVEDPNTPFLNRAVGGVYPPGSTFKLVTAVTALATGAVAPGERINSPGQIVVASELDPTQTYTYRGWKAAGHGNITVVDAISESSDTFFYQLIGGYESRRGTGPLPLVAEAERFGFGARLGIDIAGEVGGTVPSPTWKAKAIASDPSWFQGDTYNFSIGQGYLLATPLQVAAMTSVVANGGTLYRPQVVRAITNCTDAGPVLPVQMTAQVADPAYIRLVQQGMRRAVTDDLGTAKALRGSPHEIAGKTGTAQYQNNLKEHAWFTAFAPYARPELVVTVLVEGGGEGSLTALPVARDVFDAYFEGT